MIGSRKLRDIAKVVRSKNAGPFEITFDVIFGDEQSYRLVRDAGVLTRERFARLYGLAVDSILVFGWFDPVLAFKATIPRTQPQGGIGERDIHACQQHAPLADMLVPCA